MASFSPIAQVFAIFEKFWLVADDIAHGCARCLWQQPAENFTDYTL